jgi:hypothetical protein
MQLINAINFHDGNGFFSGPGPGPDPCVNEETYLVTILFMGLLKALTYFILYSIFLSV